MNAIQKKAVSDEQLVSYISKKLKYPKKALKNRTEGKNFVRFIVNADETISNAEIIRDIGDGCGKATIKMLNKFPKWMPGKENGKPVRALYTLPLTFKLEEEAKKDDSQ